MTTLPHWALFDILKIKEGQATSLRLEGYSKENKLVSIPDEILDQLTSLELLDLSGNNINELPEGIGLLANLEWLYLNNNRLESLPETIGKISSLQRLDLRHNKLTYLPRTLSQLTNLREINLSYNQIAKIPHWLCELPQLEKLFLYGNRIVSPPPEILKIKTGQPVDLNELRRYFRQQAEVGEEALFESKLLIVGEPGAGKTSLACKLVNPDALLPSKEESTEGIDVYIWTFPLADVEKFLQTSGQQSAASSEFRVNIWDFGGQEIYHATHQFFLTRRSLYIIVADAREQKTDFFYWLNLIEHLSKDSPVLIFNNAFQNRHWAINELQLQAHFPRTFQKPIAFNLANDISGLVYLRHRIQEQVAKLPHVGDILPRTWVKVRRALENDPRATVTLQDFRQLCEKNGFTRWEDILQLSGYLHDIGVILHFKDDPSLKHTVILKPVWGTDAVYRVLDNDEVQANLGHFSRSDLSDIWQKEDQIRLHDELLALMMKFQLCYAIPNQNGKYIAPQLLSEQPPNYPWKNENNIHLRYKYEAFMPKGLLARFIVVMHPYIAKQQYVWRSGVVLYKDNAGAEVTEYFPQREIRIRVAGRNKKELLAIITYELDKLHKPFHGLKFDKLIPCNCISCSVTNPPHFYKFEVLKTRLEHGKIVIECDKPPFDTVQIRPLLDDVGAAVQPAELSTLLRILNRDFNDDEFRTLCLELEINYDNLTGEGLEGKQRELLLLLERNGRLPELINLLRQKRPNFNW